jgi:hypothetical protein
MAENPFAAPAEVQPATTGLVSVEQQRAVAEVQARMLIARANPRDPRHAMDQILQDCTRVSLAQGALYEYARGGTEISGPSIRLMETIARRWGNIACGVKEVSRRDGASECIAYAWDMESGFYDERQFQVRHWRDRKGGGGYRVIDERDIYEMIANQGARRKRATLQAVIPGDVVEAAVTQCEETLKTEADTSPEALRKLVEAFSGFGVTREQIEVRCQRRIAAIRPAQVVQLRKIWASLRDEMSQVSDWFETTPQPAPAQPASGNEALRSRLAQKAAAPPQERAEAPPPPPYPPAETPPPAASAEAAEPHPEPPPDHPPEVDSPATIPVSPEDAPLVTIKPQRLKGGRGWDWKVYADELIAAGLQLPPERLGELRATNASMFDVLRASNRDEWARVNQALADHEREGAA